MTFCPPSHLSVSLSVSDSLSLSVSARISCLSRDTTVISVGDGQGDRWMSPYARILYSHEVPVKSILLAHNDVEESPAVLFNVCSILSATVILQRGFLASFPPGHGDAWPRRAVLSFYRQEALSECFI